MPTRHLLYQKDYPINDYIRVMIPTVGEVLENEDNYYSMVSMLTAMPIDMMVQLDDIGTIIQTEEGFEIPLYFEGDLHRDSLDNDLGYEGINNIVALFNNGYHAQNYVYGWWDNHSPSGAAIGHSLYNDNYAWVRSKKERDALKFIQQAISDFNGNYGSEYNITAVIAADIYEQ